MRRLTLLLMLLLMGWSQAQESQARIVRLESRIYGWYAIAHPDFDKTIGRQELFKVSGNDQFLKGLAGRLVLIEGVFQEGSLYLPALAPPPISLPEGTERRVIQWRSDLQTTEEGFQLRDPNRELQSLAEGRHRLDLLVKRQGQQLQVERLISSEELENPLGPRAVADSPAHLDLILTQDLLDILTRLALSQANLQTSYQSVGLKLSDLAVKLPQQKEQPWSLQGTVDVDFAGRTILAESSFVVDAVPVIKDDKLQMQPDWNSIRVEGQLPFSFILGTNQLGSYARYLPSTIPLFSLTSITDWFRSKGLLPPDSEPTWFLGTQTPQTARLALADEANPLPHASPPDPGSFRLVMGREVVDRLMKRQVEQMLSPETPYKPNPPMQVGKALFVPILVKEIYVRQLVAGYSEGAFRFDDLTVDVGWEAGPFSGVEPLLTTSGWVKPAIANGLFTWRVGIQELVVRSDKVPGNKDSLAAEFKPKIEQELGPNLARKQNISTTFPLARFWPGLTGELELLRLKPADNSLILEGTLRR